MAAQKLNDYTLYERESVISKNDDDWYRENCICHEFNFMARQRTTTIEFLLWSKKTKETSTSVAVSVQNFSDIEGKDEIARAHAALVRLGGKPPPLDEVLDRKITRLAKPLP